MKIMIRIFIAVATLVLPLMAAKAWIHGVATAGLQLVDGSGNDLIDPGSDFLRGN